MRKGIIGIVFCIAMIFSLAVTAQAMDQNAKNTHYGYSLLTDAEKFVYEKIYDGISRMEDKITFTAQIDAKDFKKIYRYYLADSPEHCWLWGDGNEFSYELHIDSKTDKVEMTIYYNTGKTEGASMKSKMDTAIKNLTNGIDSSLSDKDKAFIVHNRLCEHVAYDDTISKLYIHRAYGALVRNLAVCDGYSYAYQVLLNSLGIRTVTVAGYGTSIINNIMVDPGSHAWNLVEFSDDKWSYVDVTWDDHTEDLGIFHYYFGAGNEIIAGTSPLSETFDESVGKSKLNSVLERQGGKDHYIVYREINLSGDTVDNIPFELPANVVKDGYFDIEDKTYLSGYQYRMERKTDSTFFYFLYQGDKTNAADIKSEFTAWLKAESDSGINNGSRLIGLADRGNPVGNSLAVVGKEICFMLKYKAHTHTGGTATCHSKKVCEICGVEYGEVLDHKITEFHAYAAPDLKTAEKPEDGMMEHWKCTSCGGFFVKDKYGKFVEVREDSLLVAPYTPGDVNDDGAVNNKDVIMLFRYLSGAEVGKSFSLGACDPNGKEGFNNKDVVYLFNYVSYPSKRETDYALH